MKVSERDTTRLPKWAQNRIRILELDVEHWKAKALAGPETSDTFLTSGFNDDKPLGHEPRVEFRLPSSNPRHHRGYEKIEARLDADNGYVEVRSDLGVTVEPQSSNVIRIRVRP